MNPSYSDVEAAFARLREEATRTDRERDQFDWAADVAIQYLASEQEAWGPDGYECSLQEAAIEELRFRLGIQLPGMVAELCDRPDVERRAQADVRAARRIVSRLP